MLVDLKRMVSYICPFCSNISSKSITVFDFSGKPKLNLICPTHGCHESCASITPKGAKYKIEIECPLCGGRHTYSVTQESFWNRKLLTYKCPAAGIDVFFAGERREVEKMLEENSDVYSDIIDELVDEEFGEDISFNLLYAIIERLQSLKDRHALSCRCGSENIELNVINGNIILSCANCRRTKLIETSEDTLTRLLNSHAVIIDK